jgi:hypothetical protein
LEQFWGCLEAFLDQMIFGCPVDFGAHEEKEKITLKNNERHDQVLFILLSQSLRDSCKKKKLFTVTVIASAGVKPRNPLW